MSIISILMIAIGLSMDAFAVSITIGMNSCKRDKFKMSLRAGIFFGVFQGIMPLIGWLIGRNFAEYIQMIDHWIAFGLLLIIGGKMVIEAMNNEEEEQEKDYSYKRFLVLAIATSIDALAVGISFAFFNVNILIAIAIIGITTLVLSVIAVYIGDILGKVLKSKAEILGGIILIFIGTKILVEHLMN